MITAQILRYTSVVLLTSFVALAIYAHFRINNLEDKLNLAKADAIVAKVNNATCKGMLTKQNLAKAKVDAELAENMVELHEWMNKPPVIRYVNIYKDLPKDYKNAECKDVISSIRSININDL